ncbi:MAG: hypothetical protein U0572_06210 [Phycisphaerales bacterium]
MPADAPLESPQTPATTAEAASSEPSPRERRASAVRSDARWSGVPVAASLALVAFAVIFGIYGPRVVDRATPPLGIPAWDLGQAAAERHLERMMDAIHGPGADKVTVPQAESELRSILGVPVKLPDGESLGFSIFRPRHVSLPGAARAAQVFYARNALGAPDAVSLILVPDRGQYVVFSPFGRPLFLPPWEVYPVSLPEDVGPEESALLWSDGSIIRVVVALSPKTLGDAERLFFNPAVMNADAADQAVSSEPVEDGTTTPTVIPAR